MDKAGNVSGLKTFSYYIDNTSPEISDVKIKTKDKEELGNDWTSDGEPHISAGNIKDSESGIDEGTFRYAVKGSDDGKPADNEYKMPAELHFAKREMKMSTAPILILMKETGINRQGNTKYI